MLHTDLFCVHHSAWNRVIKLSKVPLLPQLVTHLSVFLRKEREITWFFSLTLHILQLWRLCQCDHWENFFSDQVLRQFLLNLFSPASPFKKCLILLRGKFYFFDMYLHSWTFKFFCWEKLELSFQVPVNSSVINSTPCLKMLLDRFFWTEIKSLVKDGAFLTLQHFVGLESKIANVEVPLDHP